MTRHLPIAALYSLYSEISTRAHFMARAQSRFPNLHNDELTNIYDAFDIAYDNEYAEGQDDNHRHGN